MKKSMVMLAFVMALALIGYGAHAAEVKASIKGTFESKVEQKDGKEVHVHAIKVVDAKDADGKEIADLKGKTLTIAGAKCDGAKCAGKEVELKGVVKDGATLEVASCPMKGTAGCSAGSHAAAGASCSAGAKGEGCCSAGAKAGGAACPMAKSDKAPEKK